MSVLDKDGREVPRMRKPLGFREQPPVPDDSEIGAIGGSKPASLREGAWHRCGGGDSHDTYRQEPYAAAQPEGKP